MTALRIANTHPSEQSASPPPSGEGMGEGGHHAKIPLRAPPPHPLPTGGREAPRPDRPTNFRRPTRIEPTKEERPT